MKKRIFAAFLACMTMIGSGISAQDAVKAFEHLAVGVEVLSTTGFGLELATPLHPHFSLRAGISLLPYGYNDTFKTNIDPSFKKTVDDAINADKSIIDALKQQNLPTSVSAINSDVNVKATLDFFNGKILGDYYPSAQRSFHVTAGVYISKGSLITVKGNMEDGAKVKNLLTTVKNTGGIDYFSTPFIQGSGYTVTVKDIMDEVQGSLKINSVKPYVGIGFGRATPNGRIGANFDIGAFYQGTPKITSGNPNIQKLVEDKFSKVSDAFKNFSVYPVISLKLTVKLF